MLVKKSITRSGFLDLMMRNRRKKSTAKSEKSYLAVQKRKRKNTVKTSKMVLAVYKKTKKIIGKPTCILAPVNLRRKKEAAKTSPQNHECHPKGRKILRIQMTSHTQRRPDKYHKIIDYISFMVHKKGLVLYHIINKWFFFMVEILREKSTIKYAYFLTN